MDFSEVNWLAVLIAGLAAWALGAIWYTALFGKIWRREVGMQDVKPTPAMMAKTFGGSFVLMTLMGVGLAGIIGPETGAGNGFCLGLLVGAFFSATTMGINYLYQGKSLTLFFIDACYQVLFLGIQGLIIGAWK